MDIKRENLGFGSHAERVLFLLGLVAFTIGQILLEFGREFVVSMRPFDYAHGLLLLGVTLMIPFAANLQRSVLGLTASVLLLLGIVAIIGMCVIDFILWSYGLGPERDAFTDHLIDTPAIWLPFVTIGAGYVFGTGLSVPSLLFLKRSKLGPLLVSLPMIAFAVLGRSVVIPTFVLVTLGYALCFWRDHQAWKSA